MTPTQLDYRPASPPSAPRVATALDASTALVAVAPAGRRPGAQAAPARPRPPPARRSRRRPGAAGARRSPPRAAGKLTPQRLHRSRDDRRVRPVRHDRHDVRARHADPDLGLLDDRRPPAPRPRPGPVLVVTEGDTVTITLHNQLAEADVAGAARASRPAPSPAGCRAATTTGVGAGRHARPTRSRPAGRARSSTRRATPPNGARQVAMGLAGALVVLPADGTAYGAAAPGTRTTTRRCWCSARSTPPSTPTRPPSTCASSTRRTG